MNFDGEKGMQWMIAAGASLALHTVVLALFVLSSADGVAERTVSSDSEKAVEADASQPPSEPSVEASAASSAEKTPSVEKPSPAEVREPKPKRVGQTKDVPKEEPKPSDLEIYVVAKGDMLFRIAQDHGCTLQELARLNGTTVKKLSNLRVGQKIKVPKKGD